MSLARVRRTMSDELDEMALIARAKRGDRASFDVLVQRHLPRVHGLLKRLVGNHEDAEDLAQETFVKAYLALKWYRAESAFTTWLYRIAVHVGRDLHRARLRRPPARPLSELVTQAATTGREHNPAEILQRGELTRGLLVALDGLPYRLRSVLVLRVFEELEYRDIARIAGITEGTARVQVVKARQHLLRALDPWLEERTS